MNVLDDRKTKDRVAEVQHGSEPRKGGGRVAERLFDKGTFHLELKSDAVTCLRSTTLKTGNRPSKLVG